MTKTYVYDAFGVEQGIDAVDANPWRYCGEYFDKETGNIYLRARYYNSSIGRFTQEDPVGDGLNWYTYCNNNPIMFVDPSGLRMEPEEWLEEAAYLIKEKVLMRGMEDFWLITREISRFITIISDATKSYIEENYEYNSQFEFTDYIYGQGSDPQASVVRMGYYTGDENGCGWVATYNALRLKDDPEHPKEIIRYYETHAGTFINGKLGVNPKVVNAYLNHRGYETHMYHLPFGIDKKIRKTGVGILMYAHKTGAHYVAIQYQQEIFNIYNEFNGDTGIRPYVSIDSWIKESRQYLPISLITIQQPKGWAQV